MRVTAPSDIAHVLWPFLKRGQLWLLDATSAAVAANLSVVQIVNPAGSGVNVVLIAFTSTVGSGQTVRAVEVDAARTTLVGGGTNLLLGGPASKAQIYTDAIGANGTALFRYTGSTGLLGNLAGQSFVPHMIIPPGKGVELEGETANTALTGRFVWAER